MTREDISTAIEVVESWYRILEDEYGTCEERAGKRDLVLNVLHDAQTPAANWTLCSVALPEDGENKSEFEYDCTLSNGISEYRWVARLQRIYCGKDGYQWITSKGYQVKDETVIAWMPKPEPYRGEA